MSGMKTSPRTLAALFAAVSAMTSAPSLCAAADAVQPLSPEALTRQIGYAEYYLKEFEREVELQRGGVKSLWRNKNEALKRVQDVVKAAPDDVRVKALYDRAKSALKKSKGESVDVPPEWTAYLANEENLRQTVWAAGEKEWDGFMTANAGRFIEKEYPVPSFDTVSVDGLEGKLVVLEDVEYPAHQFYGATGEFVACGKPSSGYWFLDIATRDWLGPYEAVKRYRRLVDPGMADVKKWTVVGRVAGVTAENPRPDEDGTGSVCQGWIVKPVALCVPGRTAAFYDAAAESSGRFSAEERIDAIKDGFYTVKEIPDDVTPERLMEIFMTAIKEKNYKLYLACIDPERTEGDYGADEAGRYHWDLHQARFHGEYVHAVFGEAKIAVVKGFDENNSLENFFLDEDEKEAIRKAAGDKVEEAVVESTAFDKNGRQLGSPHPHRLRRVNGGRWFVEDYAPRF